ncbi:MAG: translation elongation factor Ts [Candidatus Eiseniibacteriota bacterium]|nr:MAG: translation elongation factor Ts [Candidatus Eisenbacteria bacterium]
MKISSELIRQIRERTGAGMMDCKKALAECSCDPEKAVELLRKMGVAAAAKRAAREASEGLVEAYVHPGGRMGALVEVNCETDFVARTEAFNSLTRDIAMQVVASEPLVVSRDEMPQELVEKEKEILAAQFADSGKPGQVIEKIVEGKLEKFYKENCLLEQPFIKDQKRSVEEVIKEAAGKFGENVLVRRFSRFRLGQSS